MPFDYCMFSLISYRSGGLFEHGGFIIMCVVFFSGIGFLGCVAGHYIMSWSF